jgi:hypothetical protein
VFVNICVFLIRERVKLAQPTLPNPPDTNDDDDHDKVAATAESLSARRALSRHPMKNDATEAALGLLNLADAANHCSTVPSKRAAPQDDDQPHVAASDYHQLYMRLFLRRWLLNSLR